MIPVHILWMFYLLLILYGSILYFELLILLQFLLAFIKWEVLIMIHVLSLLIRSSRLFFNWNYDWVKCIDILLKLKIIFWWWLMQTAALKRAPVIFNSTLSWNQRMTKLILIKFLRFKHFFIRFEISKSICFLMLVFICASLHFI